MSKSRRSTTAQFEAGESVPEVDADIASAAMKRVLWDAQGLVLSQTGLLHAARCMLMSAMNGGMDSAKAIDSTYQVLEVLEVYMKNLNSCLQDGSIGKAFKWRYEEPDKV